MEQLQTALTFLWIFFHIMHVCTVIYILMTNFNTLQITVATIFFFQTPNPLEDLLLYEVCNENPTFLITLFFMS